MTMQGKHKNLNLESLLTLFRANGPTRKAKLKRSSELALGKSRRVAMDKRALLRDEMQKLQKK